MTKITTGILLQLISTFAYASTYVIHVDPEGTNGALTTLEQARDELRSVRTQGGLPDGAEVRVHGGDYVLEKPFVLEVEDSGTSDAPIRYIAEKNERVRLLGGRIVEDFRGISDATILSRLDESARPHVVQVDLKEQGIADFGSPQGGGLQLFMNGQRMTLARWPNAGFVNIASTMDEDHEIHGRKGSKLGKFVYDDARPERWLDEADAWVHGYWFWDWAEQRHAIASIDTEKKIIALEEPYHGYGYRKDQWYYAYNLLSELDAPGEWYLDRDKGILYFWPPDDLATAEVMVTVRPTLVKFQDVSHVTFQGMTLEGARSTMIIAKEGASSRFNALTIRNGGGSAISISGGENHGVSGCDIYGMGRGGISLSGGDRTTLTPAGHFAENNHIHDFAQVKRVYQSGIQISGVGNRVAHNLIHDAPHMAIGFGGNDHVIEFNEIHDVCLETNDAGAIYTGRNWTMRGHKIRFNHLYDITGFRDKGCVGVYLDDMFSSAEIYGNVFRNVYRAAFIGGGRDISIVNNIFIDCPKALHIDARALGWAYQHADDWIAEEAEKGTISGIAYNKPPYSVRYPELVDIISNEPKAPVGNTISRNIFVGEGWNDINKDAKPYVPLQDNLSDVDPMFVDAKDGEYRLKPESPALALGFEEIPFDKIGLYESELRASAAKR